MKFLMLDEELKQWAIVTADNQERSLAAYYAWHGRHHIAHIASLRQRRS